MLKGSEGYIRTVSHSFWEVWMELWEGRTET